MTNVKNILIAAGAACLFSLPAFAADKEQAAKTPEIDPAFCSRMVTYQEPPGVEYQPGVDVHGNPVVEPDLNPSPIKMPDTVTFDLTVDTAQYLGLTAPAGLEGKMKIGTIAMKDGHVTFNGQPLEGQAEATLRNICAQQEKDAPKKEDAEKPAVKFDKGEGPGS
ncbi:MAG: hypothetical protein GC185_11495 [Alphaproteobacteria bacterium]|nr:hypothetical protein [Alphaproteobacteria bacterium]